MVRGSLRFRRLNLLYSIMEWIHGRNNGFSDCQMLSKKNRSSRLKEYAQYVEQVRTFAKEIPFPEAVKQAVEHCIKNGILSDFLSENRAEAIAVSIFEYDEEKHIQSERKEWREIGREEGRAEGENKALRLMQRLTDAGKTEEMRQALSDPAYREQLYREYGQ